MAVDPPDATGQVEEKKGEEEEAACSSPPALFGSPSPEEIKAVAQKYASCPLLNPDPGVWGVLTAISQNARLRPQGTNIILTGEEHVFGRSVEESFRIPSYAISKKHCSIYRRKLVAVSEDAMDNRLHVFLKDSSMNGTFLNWEKLSKSAPASRLNHGDIISFLGTPDSGKAHAFVYREVSHSASSNGPVLKRKSEDQSASLSKRVKGLGIGDPDGPILLDDVRSLQRSNTELRKQLESHALTIENLQSEARESTTRHGNEMKELKESISNSFLKQIHELQHLLKVQQKDLDEAIAVSSGYQDSIKYLNERLDASMQSRSEADEIINSQKAMILERELLISEERSQRKVEREKAAADLKSALQKAHSEAQEEIKRQADIHLQQQREQQEFIIKLQESEKESQLLVETMRSKLEDMRESLVLSEKKVRQAEALYQEERIVSESNRKRSEMLELEVKALKKELENEKVAREEAWAKVSALELEISTAIRELSFEKQRFQGARERIILRESQLRAFYSTTEEISALLAKQQEQLKTMQKTLEDEDNYDNTSIGFDVNAMAQENNTQASFRVVRKGEPTNPMVDAIAKGGKPKVVQRVDTSSSNGDASVTEKHECDAKSSDDVENTQDLEGTSADRTVVGFGSHIDGGCAMVPEGDGNRHGGETERVPETESQGTNAGFYQKAAALQVCSLLAGDTMQLDDATQIQAGTCDNQNNHGLHSSLGGTEPGMVKTADLLASEGLDSLANSTAPSVHGENESPGCGANNGAIIEFGTTTAAAALCSFDALAAGSQTNPRASDVVQLTDQHRSLNILMEILAPEFEGRTTEFTSETEKNVLSDAETEDGNNDNDDAEESGSSDDAVIEDSVT